MRYLLDKNLVRFAISGLHYGSRRPLRAMELGALTFWRTAEKRGDGLYIADVSYNVLQRLPQYDEVRIFLEAAEVLFPIRYHKRWARRIRESTGLTREDVSLVALASFGTDEPGAILGAHVLVTYDQALINGFTTHQSLLRRRLRAMTAQLDDPYRRATLPRLASPDELMDEWSTGDEA